MTDAWLNDLEARLTLPLIAAPMFLVSGVDLVTAACAAGVVGAFPTVNCRTADELDVWLKDIRAHADKAAAKASRAPAPWCANLVVHKSNTRLMDDVAVLVRHRPELVIASVGSPAPVIGPLHDVGARVLVDVATIRHAERAVAAGADGLVLLTAGAGGQTGWLNPLAFVCAVRAFYDGPLVLAGGVSDGAALFAAEAMGCGLAYMGTKFIATHESLAKDAYKDMLVGARADDILLTRAFTGLETNMLRPSIVAAGLDPDNLPTRGAIDIAKDISIEGRANRPERWRDIWSAGHSVSGVDKVRGVADLVAQTRAEYESALDAFEVRRSNRRRR
ncbi:MAG: nitronate monooxygenase [Rhodoblastus sp.]|nr:nitronate monooxygenase [Rhodoblastus sp.]